ncbi:MULTISPECIES: hypothetical protein [Corynebacterium]|uniref:Uncharacterized protein n=1 Tax=Corynebacterium antarcticum TaxID=2800405 RepID=A0A9Q4GNN5_9CORY|nr:MULTISPECIES: hypothetical protein [Corynebacterium]MCX7492072.1 hypothetical protein [Corynebacterium antarcticum]MCX7537879.1 hypothetical protein [Corynebacterium antarcticum]MCX7540044.1 hypothetical protein [Corynebacterium antarcticum]
MSDSRTGIAVLRRTWFHDARPSGLAGASGSDDRTPAGHCGVHTR